MINVGDFEYNPANILGNGAFAIVYEGRFRQNREHKVAIKAMRASDQNIAKSKNLLNKEICVLRDLDHPNIVRLYDHKVNTDGVYLFMEYCNGGDLAKVLSERRTLPEDVISNILAQLSSALDVMNLQGIMHRDLKPGNILLCIPPDVRSKRPLFDHNKNRIKYKLADFGFARFLQDGIMAATMCGSPMYMAPEVLLCKNYGITVDIWSMGVIVYQCLTGVAPFQANNPEDLKAIYRKPLDPIRFPTNTSNYLRDIIKKMLIKIPHHRISFKDIMQHPFVRGHITVDPPRKQTNTTEINKGPTGKNALAEIFGSPPPTGAPPPPPYAVQQKQQTQIQPLPSNRVPLTTGPSNGHQNISAVQQRTSAIPIPTVPSNNTTTPVTTTTTITTTNKIPSNQKILSNSKQPATNEQEDQDFIFVNNDGSIGKQKEVQRIFAASNKTERSENLLDKISRQGNVSGSGGVLSDQTNTPNVSAGDRANIDSGHTSSNTGIYGSTSSQKPFKLSMEGYYNSKTTGESTTGASPNAAVTSRNSASNRISPLRSGSSPPQMTAQQKPCGFYLSRESPVPQSPEIQSPTTPIPITSTVPPTTGVISSPTRENSIPNMLRKNSAAFGSFSNPEEPNADLNKDKRSHTVPEDIHKEANHDIEDLFEEPSDLDDDAICSNEHREESQKITAVLDMCELLFDLAEQRNALLSRPAPGDESGSDAEMESVEQYQQQGGRKRNNSSSGGGNGGMLDVISTPQRIAEQMLIYQRILSYLKTLIEEVQSAAFEKKRLIPTRIVCENMRACNTLYHRCIIKLDLLIKETERNVNFGRIIMSWYHSLSVNKMIFHYSLDQCSAAEMDAMVGGLDMCIRRYQAAMLLILGLRQHAKTESDMKFTKQVNETMQGRFIKHWYAQHDSPTIEHGGIIGDDDDEGDDDEDED